MSSPRANVIAALLLVGAVALLLPKTEAGERGPGPSFEATHAGDGATHGIDFRFDQVRCPHAMTFSRGLQKLINSVYLTFTQTFFCGMVQWLTDKVPEGVTRWRSPGRTIRVTFPQCDIDSVLLFPCGL